MRRYYLWLCERIYTILGKDSMKFKIERYKLQSAAMSGHRCAFQRPSCGAKRPPVITDFPLILS